MPFHKMSTQRNNGGQCRLNNPVAYKNGIQPILHCTPNTKTTHFSLSLKSEGTRNGGGDISWVLCSTLLPVALVAYPPILPNGICSTSICTVTAIAEGFPRDKVLYFTSYLQNNVNSLSRVCQEKTKLNSLNGIWKNCYGNTSALWHNSACKSLSSCSCAMSATPGCDTEQGNRKKSSWFREKIQHIHHRNVILLLPLFISCIFNLSFWRYSHFWGVSWYRSNVSHSVLAALQLCPQHAGCESHWTGTDLWLSSVKALSIFSHLLDKPNVTLTVKAN